MSTEKIQNKGEILMRVKQKLKNLGTRLGSAENLPESLRSQIPEFSVENFEEKIESEDDLEIEEY